MTGRRITAFLDDLADGRRPGRFEVDPEDVEIVRTAITLRTARPGDAIPKKEFISELYEKLADQAASSDAHNIRPPTMRRSRAMLVGVAASVSLIGGTFAVTEVAHNPMTHAAAPVPHETDVRTGTFEAAGGSAVGQIIAYRGHPSWVFMNIGVSEAKGTIMCKLQLNDGSIVSAGSFQINGGTGELSKTIRMDISRLRGAELLSPSGAVVASATFT
jgi:hypothetical protein